MPSADSAQVPLPRVEVVGALVFLALWAQRG